METVKIYLAGGISGLSFEEANTWRNQIKNEVLFGCYDLNKKPVFFNPMDFYNFEEVKYDSELEVMEFDLNNLRHSDCVVVNFNDEKSIGTACELIIAHELRIPVIALNEDNEVLHPWLECCCNKMFSDKRKLVKYLVEYYLW